MFERRVLVAAAASSLLTLAIPWTLSGEVNTWERFEFGMAFAALLLFYWHPRIACDIGSVVWLSAVTDYLLELAFGERPLSHNVSLIVGIAV